MYSFKTINKKYYTYTGYSILSENDCYLHFLNNIKQHIPHLVLYAIIS